MAFGIDTVLIGRLVELGVAGEAVVHPLLGVHEVRHARALADTVVTVVRNGHLLSLAGTLGTLGGDHHHAGRSARTVDGRRRRVLEDVDALDVLGVEEVHRRAYDTVDDVERRGCVVDRGLAADLDVEASVGAAVGLRDAHARHGALKGILQTGRTAACNLAGSDRTHRTGQVGFLAYTVAYHHDVIQLRGVFMQDDVDAGASGDVDPLVLHADERNEQHVLGRIGYIECELTVHIGTRTEVGAFDDDGGTYNRLTVSVVDPPPQILGRCGGRKAHAQHHREEQFERKVFHLRKGWLIIRFASVSH